MPATHKPIRETHIIGSATRERIIRDDQCPAFRHAGIFMAGVSEADAHFSFVRRNPGDGQLLVCSAGEGRVWIAGQWKTCATGSAYITPPGVLHAYHSLPGRPWHVGWILYPAGPACPITLGEPALIRLDPRPLRSAILGLYWETLAQAQPLLLEAWTQVLQLHAGRVLRRIVRPDTLWPVWNAVGADLARQWTVNDLAGIIGVSGEHLRRLCRQQLHCTPMQHVTNLRMRHAAALLTSSPQKIDIIAARVGYTNRFSFSTAFKRGFRLAPADYRRSGQRPGAGN